VVAHAYHPSYLVGKSIVSSRPFWAHHEDPISKTKEKKVEQVAQVIEHMPVLLLYACNAIAS
jgi:hypothetical protein